MALEDRTLAVSPDQVELKSIHAEVLTLRKVHDAGNLYELSWKPLFTPAKIVYASGITSKEKEARKRFVEGLKPGDQFIVVYEDERATSVYGPIDETKFLDLH